MLLWLGLAAALTSATPTDVGACVWSQLPAADRTAFLDAYHLGISPGMAALSKRDAELRLVAARCAQSTAVPTSWLQAAVASEAIQQGASQEVARSGIPRAALDDAWQHAPDAARQCARANAAKLFGIEGQSCPAPRATASFTRQPGLQASSEAARAQVLIFMNAHAQAEWANALIQKQLGQS